MGSNVKLALSASVAVALLVPAASAQPVLEGGQKFSMTLTAQAEPHGGDVNASGTADITINPGQRRVCWEITTAGVDPGYSVVAGSGAHIHRGVVGVAGDVVVPLALTLNGTNTGCTTVESRALIEEIRKSPEQFYVNVHWADITAPITLPSFAAGALRAQLEKAPLKSN